MNRIYDPSRGTLAGVPVRFVVVGVGVLAFVLYRKLRAPLDAAGGVADSVGKTVSGILDVVTPGPSAAEREQNARNVEAANVGLSKSVSYGPPTALDRSKADRLFSLMDGYFNQSKVASAMGEISNKYEMNRVYTAFGIRTIVHGGVPFFRKQVEGDLLAHFGAYDIALHKRHKRRDGTYYTIQGVLEWIGG